MFHRATDLKFHEGTVLSVTFQDGIIKSYYDGTTVGKVPPDANVDVGKEVLAARADAGWSQKELSAATGIDQSDISKIERGAANPSVNTLRRIASALGCELTIIIRKKEEQ